MSEVVWSLIAAFGGAAVGAFFGNYYLPKKLERERSPKLKLELQDDKVVSQNGLIVFHRLTVKNEGKSAAKNCEATIKLKNVTEEVVVNGNATLKSADFRQRNLLENPMPVCWSYIGNPARLTLNRGVSYQVDLIAFCYNIPFNLDAERAETPVDEDNDSVLQILIPTEAGWRVPRVILKPARYVLWVRVTGENCEPSNEVRLWIKHRGDPSRNVLEVSFTPD